MRKHAKVNTVKRKSKKTSHIVKVEPWSTLKMELILRRRSSCAGHAVKHIDMRKSAHYNQYIFDVGIFIMFINTFLFLPRILLFTQCLARWIKKPGCIP